MQKWNNQQGNLANVHCQLSIYVTYGRQPEKYDKPNIIKNISKYRKQENDDWLNSRRLEGITEKIWKILPGDVYWHVINTGFKSKYFQRDACVD